MAEVSVPVRLSITYKGRLLWQKLGVDSPLLQGSPSRNKTKSLEFVAEIIIFWAKKKTYTQTGELETKLLSRLIPRFGLKIPSAYCTIGLGLALNGLSLVRGRRWKMFTNVSSNLWANLSEDDD